jgi:hypothetical protein
LNRAATATTTMPTTQHTAIVQRVHVGSGRNGIAAAPTRAKASPSSRCIAIRLPPARFRPGQRGPAATFSTATFEASPSRQGRTVSRKEPTALAA